MLDMGFEREMDECLTLIKKRCPDKFTKEAALFHSDSIKINFVSATLSPKIEQLGSKLMKEYTKVGFKAEGEDGENQDNYIGSIPQQVKQFWVEVPAQYKLLYLLIFLYCHQDQKVIVFASNCEVVNLLTQLAQELDWNKCINKRGRHDKNSDGTVQFKDNE